MSTSTATDPFTGTFTAIASRVGRRWWLLVIPGIAWIVVGFAVLRYDAATVAVNAVVFEIMVLLAALGEVFAATITFGAWRAFHIVFAVLLAIGAVSAFVDPGGTFVSLAFGVAFYCVLVGTLDVVSRLFEIGTVPGWWLGPISGVFQLLVGSSHRHRWGTP